MTFAFHPTAFSKSGFDTGMILALVFFFPFLLFSLYATLSLLLAFDARAGRKQMEPETANLYIHGELER
jgi:hypothetical protein